MVSFRNTGYTTNRLDLWYRSSGAVKGVGGRTGKGRPSCIDLVGVKKGETGLPGGVCVTGQGNQRGEVYRAARGARKTGGK